MRYLAGLIWLLALPVRGDAGAFADGTMAIPLLAWVIAAVVAIFGGATSVLMRLANIPPTITLSTLAVGQAMWMSLMSGAVGFLSGLIVDAATPMMILMIFGSALGGTRIIEALVDQMRARIGPKG